MALMENNILKTLLIASAVLVGAFLLIAIIQIVLFTPTGFEEDAIESSQVLTSYMMLK